MLSGDWSGYIYGSGTDCGKGLNHTNPHKANQHLKMPEIEVDTGQIRLILRIMQSYG